MGLLDRARKLQGNAAPPLSADSPAPPSRKGGLLSRATAMRSADLEAVAGKPKLKPLVGLLARAKAMRQSDPAAEELQQGVGLLQRALAFRRKEQESRQSIAPPTSLAPEAAPLPVVPPPPREEGRGLLARAAAMRDAAEPPPIEEVVSVVPDPQPTLPETEPVEESETTLHYEGNSAPEADPALVTLSETTDQALATIEKDPFYEWEREAREIALQDDQGSDDALVIDSQHLELLDDDDFSTRPVESHIASQKKIDHYLSLFDITKEIANIDDLDALWDTLLYAVMGQVSAQRLVIFAANRRSEGSIFYPVSSSGVEVVENWALKPGDEIYDRLRTQRGCIYAEELLLSDGLSAIEREILVASDAALLLPIKNGERYYGVVAVSSRLDEVDYSLDDMEFLTLLGEMTAVGVERQMVESEMHEDSIEMRRRNELQSQIFSAARSSANVRDLDDLYDLLATTMQESFGVDSWSLVLLQPADQCYRIFSGSQISPTSIERFTLGVDSDLVAMVGNITRLYDLQDFRENSEILHNYTNDDISLMDHYWVVPLINLNWLVGFLTIHRSAKPWLEFEREMIVSLAEIFAPIFANAVMLSERESIFRDPFSPLEKRLRLELQKSAEFQAPISLVELRLKNLKRILALNPTEEISRFFARLNKTIAATLSGVDFMARIGQGRFAVILPGRNRDEAEIYAKKLRQELKRAKLLSDSPVELQYSHQIVTAPDDAIDVEKMLSRLEQ